MNYWKTCIEEAVDELGIAATEQQIKDLSEIVEGAHDNYGMAMGHECIPNPLATELAEARRKKESAVKEAEAREDALKKNIASRYNFPVWVYVRDGRVEVEAQR